MSHLSILLFIQNTNYTGNCLFASIQLCELVHALFVKILCAKSNKVTAYACIFIFSALQCVFCWDLKISANKGKYSLVKLVVTIIDTAGITRPTGEGSFTLMTMSYLYLYCNILEPDRKYLWRTCQSLCILTDSDSQWPWACWLSM